MLDTDIYEKISRKLLLNDCETFFSIFHELKGKEYESIFYLQVIPYMSMLCVGILDFYSINSFEENNIKDKNLKKLIMNMRIKVKLYSEKNSNIDKSIKYLGKIHLEYYQLYKELYDNSNYFLRLFSIIKLYDFGTYRILDKFIGNMYLNSWYLNEILDVKEAGTEISKENIMMFSSNLGCILGFVCNENHISDKKYILNSKINIKLNDFLLMNTKSKIFNDTYNRYISLILFNITCSINFVIYFLGKILPKDNEFYFRLKFNSYYYSIFSLRKLINYANNHKDIKTGVENYIKEIEELEKLKSSLGEKSKLRNCLLHYRITEEDIEQEKVLLDSPFFGLIERYTEKDYYTFNKELEDNLKGISSLLEKWIFSK